MIIRTYIYLLSVYCICDLTYVIFYVIDKTKTIRSGECCYYQVAVFEYNVSYRHD